MRIRQMRIKICLVGNRGVGKTSLIKRFSADKFAADEKGTLGAHLIPIEVEIPLDAAEVAKVKVDLFDFMGEHALRDNFRDALFYGAHGIVAVCDLGRPETLRALFDWIQAATSVAGAVPVVVAFNKADLGQNVAIGAADMRSLVERLPGASTHITSAKTGQGVEEAFNRIILRSVEGILATQKQGEERENLRYQIMSVLAHREAGGRTKGEIIGAFKSWDPRIVMEELDNLVALGLVLPLEYTKATFVNTQSIPVTCHFGITEDGKKAVESTGGRGLVVGEP